VDYKSIDLLLSLRHPRSSGYDEICFVSMGPLNGHQLGRLQPNP